MTVISTSPQNPELLRLYEELCQVRWNWKKSRHEVARLEGVLAKRLEDIEVAHEDILYLREVAVAFAFVAVSADSSLRSAHTLELLREECNRCKPSNAVEIKPGFRS